MLPRWRDPTVDMWGLKMALDNPGVNNLLLKMG